MVPRRALLRLVAAVAALSFLPTRGDAGRSRDDAVETCMVDGWILRIDDLPKLRHAV